MKRKNADDAAQFIPVFLTALTVLSFLSTAVVYFLTRSMKVVVISQTRVTAQPIVDYFWPVLMVAMLMTVLSCAVTALFFYMRVRNKIRKPSVKIQEDLRRVASGDLSRTVEFWNAQEIYDVAVDLERAREALKNKLLMVNNRYNAIKNFLDQKKFEVNGENRELLKQKLQAVDELLKEFTLRRQALDAVTVAAAPSPSPIVSIEPQPDKIVKDAEEMVKV